MYTYLKYFKLKLDNKYFSLLFTLEVCLPHKKFLYIKGNFSVFFKLYAFLNDFAGKCISNVFLMGKILPYSATHLFIICGYTQICSWIYSDVGV